MLHVQNISFQYSDTPLLEKIDFAINPGEVVALIGANGAGKTTLLQLILGEIKPDEGTISRNHEVVGYVPQESFWQQGIIRDSFHGAQPWQIDYALSLVSLNPSICDKPVSALSGGQKTRLAFAQILAADPSPTLLLLDEPTNNVDAEGLHWLKQFINTFRGSILLVSHDRSFINSTATSVVELANCTIKQYGGNYDFYVQQRAIERENETQRYQAYLEEKSRFEKLIRSAKRDATHGTRRKKPPDNDKCLWTFKNEHVQRGSAHRAKALETRLDKIERIERPVSLQNYNISIPGKVPASKLLLQLDHVGMLFDGITVFSDINMSLYGSERIHVQGVNGAGKSTLLKVIAKKIEPSYGNYRLGTGISVGYFSQESDILDYTISAGANLANYCEDNTRLFRAASHFDLYYDDLRRLPGELSRGQQAKLAFTKLLLGDFHLIVLDEPTNHLDIATKERLELALQGYRGSLIIASHDAYFIDQINISSTMHLRS